MGDDARTTQRRTVSLDYGQFTLIGGELEDGWDSSPLLELAADVPVAGDGQLLLVLSPHQNNVELDLTVQVWDAEPPADADDWQQVVRGWLEIEADRLRYESPTMEIASFVVPSGRYAVEVSGRGFVAYGWPGSTTPGDVWRVRLWPSDVEQPAYAVRTWTDPAADVDPSGAVDVDEEDWADWDPGPIPTGITGTGDGSIVQHYQEEVRWDGPPVAQMRTLLLRKGTPADEIDDILRSQGVPEDRIARDHVAGSEPFGEPAGHASTSPGWATFVAAGGARIVPADGEDDPGFQAFATYEEAMASIEEHARRFAEREIGPPEPLAP